MGQAQGCSHSPGGPKPNTPAETQAEVLAAGSNLVLGFNVREAPCILAINAQHPVTHCHAGLCSFASRSELWRNRSSPGHKTADQTEAKNSPPAKLLTSRT